MSKGVQSGFSLLEISIALFIVGILAFGVADTVKLSRDYDKFNANEQYLRDVKSALLTFVQSNSYLPCPDSDSPPDGVENRTLNVCDVQFGQLPYQILGVKNEDEWGNPVRYAINSRADVNGVMYIFNPTESASFFSNDSPPTFNLATEPLGQTRGSGNYTICGEEALDCNGSTADSEKIALAAIAVIISFGENGAQTWAGNALSSEETENSDNDLYFWQSGQSLADRQGFDDQLVWIDGYEVKYSMLKTENGLQ